MNPIKQIGRYEIPIASVAFTKRRTGFTGWLRPGYDVTLFGGHTLHLTADEKAELDDAVQLHNETMQVMGMVSHLQRANRPA